MPSQVKNEEDGFFINSNTHIISEILLVETVWEDDINSDQLPVDQNHDSNPGHAVDEYANFFHKNENESDNVFYEDSFVTTKEDINNNFIIPTQKRSHRSRLTSVVLLQIKVINGVHLTRPLPALCGFGSTGALIRDSSLPFGTRPIITKQIKISTTT